MLQIHCSQQPSSQAKTTRIIRNVPQKTASLLSELVLILASVVELDFQLKLVLSNRYQTPTVLSQVSKFDLAVPARRVVDLEFNQVRAIHNSTAAVIP